MRKLASIYYVIFPGGSWHRLSNKQRSFRDKFCPNPGIGKEIQLSQKERRREWPFPVERSKSTMLFGSECFQSVRNAGIPEFPGMTRRFFLFTLPSLLLRICLQAAEVREAFLWGALHGFPADGDETEVHLIAHLPIMLIVSLQVITPSRNALTPP